MARTASAGDVDYAAATVVRRAPEQEARRILAERFARGDISANLLERPSILTWTQESDTMPDQRP